MSGVVSWVSFGLLAGVLGWLLLPGRERLGLFWMVVAGVAGAGAGGYFATEVLGLSSRDEFHLGTFLIAAACGSLLVGMWERIDRLLPGREPGRKDGEHWLQRLSR